MKTTGDPMRDAAYADAEAEHKLVQGQLDFMASERKRLGWAPEQIRAVMTQTREAMHPPYDNPDQCQFEGACGAPGVKCPKHQQHLTCRLEIDGYGLPQPGHVLTLSTVRDAEHYKTQLRETWNDACSKERPAIEAQAKRVDDRIVELRRTAGRVNACGHASSAHRVPPNVLDQETADEHLVRLRGLWHAAPPQHRGQIEASACAIGILRPLLPARSTR